MNRVHWRIIVPPESSPDPDDDILADHPPVQNWEAPLDSADPIGDPPLQEQVEAGYPARFEQRLQCLEKRPIGNAPGLTDGAAAVVVASEAAVREQNLTPLARVVAHTTAACDPLRLFEAPVLAIEKLLKKIGTTLADYDLIEVNEAFAAQILANGKVLGWDWAKVNVNGGAIALGHPIGATGTRIVVTLLHALQQRGLKRGLAGLCHGGGGAVAMSFELM